MAKNNGHSYNFVDLTGQVFNKYTVLGFAKLDGLKGSMWLCRCECGNERIVGAGNLKSNNSKGCNECSNKIPKNLIHGRINTREYNIWSSMKRRCLNANVVDYKDYGGRGIKFCDKWLKFEGFWEDMQEGYSDKLTLDRIDVNGNYEKSNCKWSTPIEQANNRRSNRNIEYNGEIHNLTEWSKILNKPFNVLRKRLERGWSIEETFTREINRNLRHSR